MHDFQEQCYILCLSLSPFQECTIKQLLDSVFVIYGKIKVSASAFGSADNTYLDLDYSGYIKNSHPIVVYNQDRGI